MYGTNVRIVSRHSRFRDWWMHSLAPVAMLHVHVQLSLALMVLSALRGCSVLSGASERLSGNADCFWIALIWLRRDVTEDARRHAPGIANGGR